MERNQGDGEILGSLKVSFLQLHNRFLLQGFTRRRKIVGKLPVKLDPLKFGLEKQEYYFTFLLTHFPPGRGGGVLLLFKSDGDTQIQTTKLSILQRFYFHDVLEPLKTNFDTNFLFKRVLGSVIEYA